MGGEGDDRMIDRDHRQGDGCLDGCLTVIAELLGLAALLACIISVI